MGFAQGLSVDTAGGWKNHYAWVLRWKERSLSALSVASPSDIHDVSDLVLAYFVWCHSFRDWLLKAGTIDRETLDRELSKHPHWKICRDIANRCRHYDLTQNPSDKHWSIGREYDMWALVEERPEKLLLNLFFKEEKYRVSDVINATSHMWEDVLEQLDIRQAKVNKKMAL